MKILDETLGGVMLLEPIVHEDHRGIFFESYNQSVIDELGIPFHPVQDNHSLSTRIGTLRGLHFQREPFAQAKMVRVVSGMVYDVVLDIRPTSPTFGQWKSYVLTDINRHVLFVPRGFAHGFCTLAPNTVVLYKTDNIYDPQHSAGILWSDASLGIPWPTGDKVVSEKDTEYPTFEKWVAENRLSPWDASTS